VTFSGTGSSDPEGQALSYAWDLDGDSSFDDSTAPSPQWVYTGTSTVTARLRVMDPSGLSDIAAIDISVNNVAPTAIIDAPAGSMRWRVGDSIVFSGRGSDPEAPSGQLPSSALSWQLIMHHCPSNCHTHNIQTFQGLASGSFAAPDHEYPSHLELRLTVTDAGGLQSSVSVLLHPQTVDLTFDTSPSGLQIVLNGVTAAAPFTRTVMVGSVNSVSALSPQMRGTLHRFTSWSHGASESHLLTAPGVPTVYVATFATGALSGVVKTPTTTQSLPALGASDWAHWGHSTVSWPTRMAGVPPQIGDLAFIGNGSPSRYTTHPFGFRWTGGTPTTSAINSTRGVYVAGAGNGFRITAPADLTPRTLTVFVGAQAAQGRLVAHLSDDSAPDYVDTSVGHADAIALGRYQLTYQSASPGQTLTVTYTQSDPGAGVVAIQAAALTAGPALPTPTPTHLQAAVAGNEVTLRWEAPTAASPATGYIVEAGSAPGLRDLLVVPTGSAATMASAIAPNGTYHVRLRAITATGITEPSNEVVVQVGCLGPPATPDGLLVDVAGTYVTLMWNDSDGAVGYVVQAGSASGLSDVAVARVTGSTVATPAPPGTYFARVVGFNACGASAPSDEVIVRVVYAQ
jgi:hypothetical protein